MTATFQPISVARLYRLIANQIKAKVEGGEYAPGARLPSERELAEVLNVSRPSVREALIALEIEGYVEVRVGTGVFVTGPAGSADASRAPVRGPAANAGQLDVGAHDVLEVRLLVEPRCAALAAKNGTPEQLQLIADAVAAMESPVGRAAHDDSFHIAIAEASGNVALASTVQNLLHLSGGSQIVSKLNQHYAVEAAWQSAHAEHQAVLRAIQKRSPAAATRAMQAHLHGVQRRLGLDPGSE